MFLIQPRRKGALSENNLFSAARAPRPDLLRHSPRYQTFPALSWAYQSSVISTGAPFSVTVSRTTRVSIPWAIIFVLSVTSTPTFWFVPFAAEAFSAVVLAPHAPATARLVASASATTHQGSRTLPIQRSSSSIAAVRSLPCGAFFLPFLVRRSLYQPLSQAFVYVKPESSIASEREDTLSAR